jgi:hypothetical protein
MNRFKTALKAIEYLTGDDFSSDLEWVTVNERKNIKDPLEMLKKAAEVMGQIYRISHAENDKCRNHNDWKKEKYKILKAYEKS